MIRPAEKSDIPRMLEMAEMFYQESGQDPLLTFDRRSVDAMFRMMIVGDASIFLVSVTDDIVSGIFGAVVAPFLLNNSVIVCQELFWWVHPSFRGSKDDLLSSAEQKAKEMGAHVFILDSVDTIKPAAMKRLYERRGFRLSDHSFVKGLR